MKQEQAPAAKETRVQRFMRSTDKLRFFLGPASRLSGDASDAELERMKKEEEYFHNHWEEYVSEDGRRYLVDKP